MPTPSDIEHALRARRGAASRQELQRDLGISQPTASRLLAPLIADGRILRVGAGKHQIYLLPQYIGDVGASIPVTRIDAEGRPSRFATLIPLAGGRFCVERISQPPAIFEGLPWFISDMRPQGFLGRMFSKSYPSLNLEQSPNHWNDADTLRAISLFGDDLPGNLIVGGDALNRHLHQTQPEITTRGKYSMCADRAMQGDAPGSSAGGEQPKFCMRRDDGAHLIVKFSPTGDTPVARRWRDLLVCEHLALETLRNAGELAANSSLHIADRVYLEVERFDRTANGRIGMVSLHAFDAEFIGQEDRWSRTAVRMRERGLMETSSITRLLLLEAFASLIANSDRHYGNISLLRAQGAWQLAPAYDMLPMFYAPTAQGVPENGFDLSGVHPTAETLDVWARASDLAAKFWRAAYGDARISPAFRKQLKTDSAAWLQRFERDA